MGNTRRSIVVCLGMKCDPEEILRLDESCISNPKIEISNWTGDPARLTLVPNWAGRDVRSLTVGVDNTSLRFYRIVLKPLGNQDVSATAATE